MCICTCTNIRTTRCNLNSIHVLHFLLVLSKLNSAPFPRFDANGFKLWAKIRDRAWREQCLNFWYNVVQDLLALVDIF